MRADGSVSLYNEKRQMCVAITLGSRISISTEWLLQVVRAKHSQTQILSYMRRLAVVYQRVLRLY